MARTPVRGQASKRALTRSDDTIGGDKSGPRRCGNTGTQGPDPCEGGAVGSIPSNRGQTCPICGNHPSSTIEHRTGDLVALNLLCPAGHIWQTKWTEAA